MKNIDDSGLGRIELFFALRQIITLFHPLFVDGKLCQSSCSQCRSLRACNGLWVAATSGILAPSVKFVDIFQ